ncbi:MAG: ribonuclease HI [Clostridiales bacterium]|nr:ribonuclease HI [Clostridiales bacterium]
MSYIIYTDGSCRGNGTENSSGGFGVVITKDNKLVATYRKDCETSTTNNREELKAILYAFLNYGVKEENDWNNNIPIVYSDSNYCVQTFNDWMFKWAKNNWIKSDKKIPENLDLIQAYYVWYQEGYRIDLRKVKGHAGQKWNEMADGLATGRIQPIK